MWVTGNTDWFPQFSMTHLIESFFHSLNPNSLCEQEGCTMKQVKHSQSVMIDLKAAV